MRFFPSAHAVQPQHTRDSRRRRVPALVAIAALTATMVTPRASAEDESHLRHEQREVQSQIEETETSLSHTSKRLARTTGWLRRAQSDLLAASTHLGRIRARLNTARAEQGLLGAELERAESRLRTAKEQLRDARIDVATQRELLRRSVLQIATHGSPELAAISSLMSSGSLEEVSLSQTAADIVVGREVQDLDDLESAENLLADREATIQIARDDVATQKAEADGILRHIRGLYRKARSAKERVRRLAGDLAAARRVALVAEERERRALRRLEAREEAIRRQIVELADDHPGSNYTGETGNLLQFPVEGTITSPYGYRTHPIYGYYSLHDGVDIGAPCGTPLWAGEAGKVLRRYYDSAYGNRIFLSIGRVNGANFTLVYNHMESAAVAEGATVGRGAVVGYVGNTGWSTGCHVHFTVLRNGQPVDPMNYM